MVETKDRCSKQGAFKFVYHTVRILTTIFLVLIASFSFGQDQPAYILKSACFGGGSYFIDDYQFEELRQLVDSVKNIRDYTITIHSHTDNIGGAEYNEWLSEMRGDAAIEKLLFLDFKSN